MPRKVSKHTVPAPKGARKEPAYSEDGVDLTLIRCMLLRTPAQRLDVLQDPATTIMRMRTDGPNT